MIRYLLLFGICIVYSCQSKIQHDRPEPQHNIVVNTSDSAMVVTAHPLATKAGIEILRKGGNAIDAAIAAHFALAVVYPRAGNLGGGGFLVYRSTDGVSDALDFREKAPSQAFEKMYQDSAGNIIRGKSLKGPTASGVPGSVAGMEAAFLKYSSLKNWEELLEPAIGLAKEGFIIDSLEALRLNSYQEAFKEWNTKEESPLIQDEDWKVGDRLIQTELAKTLEMIQQKGKDGFYSGFIAEQIDLYMSKNGGYISTKDLEDYTAVWRKPLKVNYENCTMISMPPPSSGGLALGQLLIAIELLELNEEGLFNPSNAHKLIEAERRVYADRAEYLGDPDFVEIPVNRLLDSLYIKRRLKDFDPTQPTKSQMVRGDHSLILPESFETTHTSIIDAFGNAVSLTTTLNSNYGSKVMIPKTGILMNNEMDDFSSKPGVPNQFGLVGNQANAIAPHKRMLSSMTPTIFEKDGDLFLVLGTPGGSTIITSVFQVFLWVHKFGLNVDQAIARGRFHHQWLPETVMIEGDAVPALAQPLSNLGHPIDTVRYLGYVKGIQLLKAGSLLGSGDPRSRDHAEGY